MDNEKIRLKITQLEEDIQVLKNELIKRNSYTLMYMKKRGKHTFVLQPNEQKANLIANGWIEYSKKQLDYYLKKYEL